MSIHFKNGFEKIALTVSETSKGSSLSNSVNSPKTGLKATKNKPMKLKIPSINSLAGVFGPKVFK